MYKQIPNKRVKKLTARGTSLQHVLSKCHTDRATSYIVYSLHNMESYQQPNLTLLHTTLLILSVTSSECISIVKPTRRAVSQIYFILEQHSARFGRSLRPSSGV